VLKVLINFNLDVKLHLILMKVSIRPLLSVRFDLSLKKSVRIWLPARKQQKNELKAVEIFTNFTFPVD